MSGTGHVTAAVVGTADVNIDGILGETFWVASQLTYGFPDAGSSFGANYGFGEGAGFLPVNTAMMTVATQVLDTADGNTANDGFAVEGFTNLDIAQGDGQGDHIRISQTSVDPFGIGTAWGYLPSTASAGGDVWLSNVRFDFTTPVAGNYAYLTMAHEIGHALGLKHSHEDEAFGPLPSQYDAMEYTIMSYKAFPGATVLGYSNEAIGFAQSFMMLDIAALQHLYGADFTTNSGDTVYSWDPSSGNTLVNGEVGIAPGGNRIFATIWDGGGVDTYDLSAYATDLQIDLNPGAASVFDDAQLALLAPGKTATGNIYNALQYKGDERSLIENATGGSGDDRLIGNDADNLLIGNGGRDELRGMDGDDTLRGNGGVDKLFGLDDDDRLFGGGGRDRMKGGKGDDRLKGDNGNDLLFGENGSDILNGGNGIDLLVGGFGRDIQTGGAGADTFRFTSFKDSRTGKNSDQIRDFEVGVDKIDLSGVAAGELIFGTGNKFTDGAASLFTVNTKGKTRIMIDSDGDGKADMRIWLQNQTSDLEASDFLL